MRFLVDEDLPRSTGDRYSITNTKQWMYVALAFGGPKIPRLRLVLGEKAYAS
jgi:hypothetical protein